MPAPLQIVSVERMRFELRFPENDHAHDALLEEQIQSAVAWVGSDINRDLEEMEADDPLLPAIQIAVIILARASYDGASLRPKAYEIIVGPLRRFCTS